MIELLEKALAENEEEMRTEVCLSRQIELMAARTEILKSLNRLYKQERNVA